ncbi:phosphoribosylglycinamide synthetase [Sphingobium sp. CR28]|uniref:phosphoribosylglycinamide synthetase n=1 Tax=Sphingobium sp. CR28 TaxID=3400272 RepID=UPI003FED3E50
MPHPRILRLSAEEKSRIKLLFLAKHARAGGSLDPVDGSHACYHHEMLTTLRGIGLSVEAGNSFEDLSATKANFVIPLLNRAGFFNSEMMAPLMLERMGKPYLGARPIIRGLSDDKHLMKHLARAHGVETCDWATFRVGQAVERPAFATGRLIVKPNASSASWGVKIVDHWQEAAAQVAWLHEKGHDAIVEMLVPSVDLAVPVIGADGPWLLPPLIYPNGLRSYEEKRNLVAVAEDPLIPLENSAVEAEVADMTRKLTAELWPFDYGRFEFRYDPASGRVSFMEVNLSCNLWSKKTISRSAGLLGIDHASLVETILTHSLLRQGVIRRDKMVLAA